MRRRRHPRRAEVPRPFDWRSGCPRHRPARSRQRPAPEPARQDRHRGADAVPDADRQPFDCAQGTRTYRIEYTGDLTSNQRHPLTAPIPGDGKPVIVEDPAATTRPQRFYRLIVLPP